MSRPTTMDLLAAVTWILVGAAIGRAMLITDIERDCQKDRVFTIGSGVDQQEFICLEKRKS